MWKFIHTDTHTCTRYMFNKILFLMWRIKDLSKRILFLFHYRLNGWIDIWSHFTSPGYIDPNEINWCNFHCKFTEQWHRQIWTKPISSITNSWQLWTFHLFFSSSFLHLKNSAANCLFLSFPSFSSIFVYLTTSKNKDSYFQRKWKFSFIDRCKTQTK